MASLPYIQFYPADYLSDTMHLTTEEHGAYLLLILNYWQTGKPIPKKRLQRIARVTDDKWPDVKETLSEFFEDDGQSWVHLRIENDINLVHTAPRGQKLPGKDSLKGYRGYVYFITSDEHETIKIGYSKNPWARVKELRRSHGGSLSVVATIKTTEKSEVSVHRLLEKYRIEDEWFYKSELIIDLISSIFDGSVTTLDGVRSFVADRGVADTTTTNTDTDTDTDKKKNIRANALDGFEEFWDLYDKKQDRAKCERKWKNLTKQEKQKIKKVLPKYIEATPDKQYRKNPYTWLNGKNWNDEVLTEQLQEQEESEWQRAVRLAKELELEPFKGAPYETPEKFMERVANAS